MGFFSDIGKSISSVTQPVISGISNVISSVPIVGKPLAGIETGTLDYMTGDFGGASQAFKGTFSDPQNQQLAVAAAEIAAGVPPELTGIGGAAGTPTGHLPTVIQPGASSYGKANGGLASPTPLPGKQNNSMLYLIGGVTLVGAYFLLRRKH